VKLFDPGLSIVKVERRSLSPESNASISYNSLSVIFKVSTKCLLSIVEGFYNATLLLVICANFWQQYF